jgi:hypothetical protein
MIIYRNNWLSVLLALCLVFVGACSSVPRAQSALTTINNPQGGTIVYGLVSGATSPASAMAQVLHTVQSNCSEKPQVGKVFRAKGSNSDAVFFTVVNHPQGNKQVAGMIIAAQTGPKSVEAAMVSDDAARFSSTMNPLLKQLFTVWHPGGTPNSSPSAGSASTSAPAAGNGGAVPPLRRVTLPDNTASVGLPNGWTMDPGWGGGTMGVTGPHGERIGLNLGFTAIDPTNPFQRQHPPNAAQSAKIVIYPYNVDPVKAFSDIFQQMRRVGGLGPTPLQITHAERVAGAQGRRCVHATGSFDPNGKGICEMNMVMCATTPAQTGMYGYTLYESLLPVTSAGQERATAAAILASYQVNTALINQQVAATTGPVIAAMNANVAAQAKQAIDNIHQIGANATARMNATEAANQQQWAGFDQQESNISRQGQGFSNYLLDQSVVQNNNVGGSGMVGHATMWNTQANALVQSNPNKYEFVPEQNYWAGTDFQP